MGETIVMDDRKQGGYFSERVTAGQESRKHDTDGMIYTFHADTFFEDRRENNKNSTRKIKPHTFTGRMVINVQMFQCFVFSRPFSVCYPVNQKTTRAPSARHGEVPGI